MTNTTKTIGVRKEILKWSLIVLGIFLLVQIVFLMLYPGVLRAPSTAPENALEKFYVSSFSPDSKRLYLEFSDAVAHKVRIGWMDLQTYQVTLFEPQDTQDRFASPSSSADGRRLAIVIKEAVNNFETSQIGIVDLENNSYRMITNSNSYKLVPSFSRDGKKVIYAQSNRIRESGKTRFSDWDIYETDISTGREKRLTHFCFFSINNPFYFDERRFVFSGEPSSCNEQIKGGGTNYPDSREEYFAQYQGNTVFMMDGNETKLKPLFVNSTDSHGAFLTRDNKIFFISRTNEIDGIKCCNFNYDIFEYGDGVIKRLTNLKTVLSGLVVSPRGDLAIYLSDRLRNHSREYWMMNIKDGRHKQMEFGNSKDYSIVELTNRK